MAKPAGIFVKQRLEEALATLQQIPDSVWHKYPYKDYLGGDPFFLDIYKTHVAASADAKAVHQKTGGATDDRIAAIGEERQE